MPQMAPINWLSLFFMFSLIYLIFCILNYFNYFLIYPTKNLHHNNKNSTQNKFLTWKW